MIRSEPQKPSAGLEPDALRAATLRTREAARVSSRAQLLAVRAALPDFDMLAAFAAWAPSRDRFYWEQSARGRAVVTHGCVKVVEASGQDRMSAASAELADILAGIEVVGAPAPAAAGPLFVGGFAFADIDPAAPARGADEWRAFPSGRMVLPEVTLSRRDGALYCTVVRSIAPNADVDREAASFTARLDGVERIAAETAQGPGRWRAAEAGAAGSEALESLFAEAGAEYHVSADRSHAAYRAQVSQALEAIARGDFEKVVVARSLEVQHRGRFALRRFLDELRRLYPSCTVFCVGRGSDSLIAASPEHLVSLDGETVEVAALAGSAPRGRTPEHDDALGRALRESKKDQAEHETVVRAVRAALADVCEALDGPETPRLLRLEGIQHLHTPLRGVLRGVRLHDERLRVLDLVARLHPTPAVGGLPRRPALAWLEQHERLQRGWYAAPVGFVDATGGGEFWLALRAALVREAPPAREAAGAGEPAMSRARLYAGAGIVQGSVPELELAETRLKLRALLAPLTEI